MSTTDEVVLDYLLSYPDQLEPILSFGDVLGSKDNQLSFLKSYHESMSGIATWAQLFQGEGTHVGDRLCYLRVLSSETGTKNQGNMYTRRLWAPYVAPENESALWRLACVCQDRLGELPEGINRLTERPVNQMHAILNPWFLEQSRILESIAAPQRGAALSTHIHDAGVPLTMLISRSECTDKEAVRIGKRLGDYFESRRTPAVETDYEVGDHAVRFTVVIPHKGSVNAKATQLRATMIRMLEGLQACNPLYHTHALLQLLKGGTP